MDWSVLFTCLTIVAWLIQISMIFIVPVNRRPSSALAWLLLIFIVPYLGLFIFLLLGSPKLPVRRRELQSTANLLIEQEVKKIEEHPELSARLVPAIPDRYAPFIALNANLSAMPAFAGNAVQVYFGYAEPLELIAAEIEQAHEYVCVEYFALSRDEETEAVFVAMERACKRGVRVRVLLDQLGSRKYPNYKKMLARLEEVGIEYHLMLPMRFFGRHYTRYDLRNHRKIVVVDGRVGFMGSQNMIKQTYFRKDSISYDETVCSVRGSAVVQLLAVFLTDWYAETGELIRPQSRIEELETLAPSVQEGSVLCQVLPSGSGFETENNLKLFNTLFYAARYKIMMTNPYFVPDESLLLAINSAAQRGIEVILINSEASDQFLVSHAQHSFYAQLLRSGVQIYWYPAPKLLHAKHISIDDDIAVIGSSNMDIRSFELNMEITMVCYDRQVALDLHRLEELYLQRSRKITLAEWERRPVKQKLFESVSRLTSSLQ